MTRASSTERWRRWKARQETGETILPFPIDHALIDQLLELSIVTERGSRSRPILVSAIKLLLTNALAEASAKQGRFTPIDKE